MQIFTATFTAPVAIITSILNGTNTWSENQIPTLQSDPYALANSLVNGLTGHSSTTTPKLETYRWANSSSYEPPTHTITLPLVKPVTENLIITVSRPAPTTLTPKIVVAIPSPTPFVPPPPVYATSTTVVEVPNTMRYSDHIPYNAPNCYNSGQKINRKEAIESIDQFCFDLHWNQPMPLPPGFSRLDRKDYRGVYTLTGLEVKLDCEYSYDLSLCRYSLLKIVDECNRKGVNGSREGLWRICACFGGLILNRRFVYNREGTARRASDN